MKLKFKESKTSVAVYCKGYLLGHIQPNMFVRREKATQFSGMGTTFYYDNLEQAKEKLATDLYGYFTELCTDEE